MIDPEIENELQLHLRSDEKLIWTGKPRTGIIFRQSDYALIPFSLFICGFAYVWVSKALQASPMFALFGIPLVFGAFHTTIGRFLADARIRKYTRYGITNDRVIIKLGNDLKSLNINSLPELTISENNDGSGTIMLGPTGIAYNYSHGMQGPGAIQPPHLDCIDNVKEVYDLLVKLQRQ